MSTPLSVKVSSRHQIALPSSARHQLHIQPGDRLLVDVQDGMLVLIPERDSYVNSMAGLGRTVWTGIDTDAYMQDEREAWRETSSSPSPD